MKAKICIRAMLIAAILMGGVSASLPEWLGSGVAEAKDYYTRKRVNGRWVTGRFPKRSTEKASKARVAEAAPAPSAPAAAPVQAPPSTPLPQAAGPAPAALEQNRLVPLQRALEQRARSMAARESGPVPNVRSVTYDFDRGRKTIIYLDGTMREEPLDPAATGQVNTRP